MITWVQSLPVGNVLRLFLAPPASAARWRILRRTSDAFTGPDDAGAVLAYEGADEVVQDIQALANGTEYVYRVYYWDGLQWTDGGVASSIPESILEDESADVLVLLRDRLAAAMSVDVAAGRLHHPKNKIHCLTAPPRKEDTVFPVVTIQLNQDASGERVLGETIAPDEVVEPETKYREYEGWYSRVQLEVVGWSFNPDERIALRQALKRAVIGNLPIFEGEGLRLIEFSQQDSEDYQTYDAPVYMTWGTFTCLASSVVSAEVGAITDVITEITWG